jgi:Arc/MetJ-type ribon-helix-helix transcriptional regulator
LWQYGIGDVTMSIDLNDLVVSGVYPDADTAVREALRVLWQERLAVRTDVAVHKYRIEGPSVAAAVALAGVSFHRMKEILYIRSGQATHLSPTASQRPDFISVGSQRPHLLR